MALQNIFYDPNRLDIGNKDFKIGQNRQTS